MYDGIITTSHPDPALTIKGTLKDGRTVYVVRDGDPESPDAWGDMVKLVLVGRSARDYRLGTSYSEVEQAWEHFENAWSTWGRDGVRRRAHDTDEAVARYMRIFHNAEVKAVSLQDYRDYANGYVVLDLAGAEREGITDVAGALDCAEKTWQQYFERDVYGFIVVDEETGEEDSCWGFYGEPRELVTNGFHGDAYSADDLAEWEWA